MKLIAVFIFAYWIFCAITGSLLSIICFRIKAASPGDSLAIWLENLWVTVEHFLCSRPLAWFYIWVMVSARSIYVSPPSLRFTKVEIVWHHTMPNSSYSMPLSEAETIQSMLQPGLEDAMHHNLLIQLKTFGIPSLQWNVQAHLLWFESDRRSDWQVNYANVRELPTQIIKKHALQ